MGSSFGAAKKEFLLAAKSRAGMMGDFVARAQAIPVVAPPRPTKLKYACGTGTINNCKSCLQGELT